jgi:hypothetical protein
VGAGLTRARHTVSLGLPPSSDGLQRYVVSNAATLALTVDTTVAPAHRGAVTPTGRSTLRDATFNVVPSWARHAKRGKKQQLDNKYLAPTGYTLGADDATTTSTTAPTGRTGHKLPVSQPHIDQAVHLSGTRRKRNASRTPLQ